MDTLYVIVDVPGRNTWAFWVVVFACIVTIATSSLIRALKS